MGALLVPSQKTTAKMRGSLSDALRKLSTDMQDKILRPAVFEGADLLARELEVRAPSHKGVLKSAIYTKHLERKSVNGHQAYAVGVNVKKAPHWHLVEFGHWRFNRSAGGKFWLKSRGKNKGRGAAANTLPGALPKPEWVPAHPYLRPTADRMPDAIRAMQRRLVSRMREVMAELHKGAA